MKPNVQSQVSDSSSMLYYTVGSFTFRQGNISAELEVKDDITSLEVANLSIFLAQASISKCIAFFAWVDFIKEKKLERHFIFNEEKNDNL